jgi:outer membrane receptor protein involved in Fe transport
VSPCWLWIAVLPGAQAIDARSPPSARIDDAAAIVVTGERVRRSVHDTASSVAVIGRKEIEAAGASQLNQILALVPNVQLGNGSQGPAIRGQDTTGPLYALPAFLGGNRPRTTIVVDGRPVTYNEFVFGPAPLWDVERIEVYRSPQTTTQGQNSIAGAIFVFSEDPAFEPEAKMRLIGGDYRTGQLSFAASAPLSRHVAARVVGDLRYSRTTSRITDDIAGAEPNHEAVGLVRAKLLVQPGPSDGSRLLVTLVHSLSQAPQTVGVSAPFRERADTAPNYGVFRVRADSVTAAFRRPLGAELTVNVQASAGDTSARRFAFPGFGEAQNDGTDWSSEAVVNWNPRAKLSGVAGLSHAHNRLRQRIDLSLLSGLTGGFDDWQDGTGLFGEVTVGAVPRMVLTAGVRYQQDRQKRLGGLVTDSFSVPIDYIGRFHAWLPKLSLAYDLSPAWRVGILVQKAYNPGGTTIRFDTAQPDTFAAEALWDTELFARGSVAGDRLLLSANVFNYAMRNAQRAEPIIITTPTGRRAGFANLFNVPRAYSRGLEAEAGWRAGSRLTLRGSIGLLETRISATDAESAIYQDHQFDRSPHFTGAVAIDWRPLPALRLSAQLRHHDSYFSDNANKPQLRVDGATIADVRAEYGAGRFSVFLQGHNVFDQFAMLSLATATSGEAEDPRRLSAGIEARF